MIAWDNSLLLGQAEDLLKSCEKEVYARKVSACFDSSVGGHIRHVLDHYHCFLRGVHGGDIDYDARDRDLRLEEDPAVAAAAIRRCRDELERLAVDPEIPVTSRMDTGVDDGRRRALSTVGRELQFLLSHTVHHYALIATILRIMGVAVPEGFGIAPSTLRYRREAGVTCAR